jgi:hypothetical protein
MSFQQKFLVEFVVLTFGAIYTLSHPAIGLQLSVIAIAITRFGLKGANADSWSVLSLIIVTGIALSLLLDATSRSIGQFLLGDAATQMNGKPRISNGALVLVLWAIMAWRLRKRYQLTTPPIV